MVALGAIIACLVAAGTAIALTHSTAQATGAHQDGKQAQAAAVRKSKSGPLRVLSVTPADGSTAADGAAPVRVKFSTALAAGSPMPRLRPAIAGSWKQVAGNVVEFIPQKGFGEHVHVRLGIPGGPAGVQAPGGRHLAQPVTVAFRTGAYSGVRLAELLAQLGYLPLRWTAAGSTGTSAASAASTATAGAAAGDTAAAVTAQRIAAFAPPAGTFAWKPGYPSRLHRMWHGGRPSSLIIHGAVRAFEADHGMIMDGVAGSAVWRALFTAAVKGQSNRHGYTYAVADQKAAPETLAVWHNGRLIFRQLANTGIPVSPTGVGTFPVYLRYQNQIMRGTNPDGSTYADPVAWVAYFNGGDAVHYFPRYSYGSQQSLGCVELPWRPAKRIWPYLTYGTLVTVTPL